MDRYFQCGCGNILKYSNKARHFRTLIHKVYLQKHYIRTIK